MTVNLAADYSLVNLTRLGERLQDELESISGIREVDLVGGIVREVQVNVDLTALTSYNLAFGTACGRHSESESDHTRRYSGCKPTQLPAACQR